MTLCLKCARNAGNCDYLCSNKAVKGWTVKGVAIKQSNKRIFAVNVIACPNYEALPKERYTVSGLKRIGGIRV